MNIGELDGVKIILSPEAYAEAKKQKLIEENKILNDLQQQLDKYKNVIDKIKELIERKLSTETYQHLKKLYDDIDSTEEIWEDYEFEDLLDILELLEEVE